MEERWRLESSPVHRAIWERGVDLESFDSAVLSFRASVRAAMDQCLTIVRRHKQNRSLYGPDGTVAPEVIA